MERRPGWRGHHVNTLSLREEAWLGWAQEKRYQSGPGLPGKGSPKVTPLAQRDSRGSSDFPNAPPQAGTMCTRNRLAWGKSCSDTEVSSWCGLNSLPSLHRGYITHREQSPQTMHCHGLKPTSTLAMTKACPAPWGSARKEVTTTEPLFEQFFLSLPGFGGDSGF